MTSSLLELDAHQLAPLYHQRRLSPREVLQAVLTGIEAQQQRVNAYSFIDIDGALALAAESEARWVQGRPIGPLDGVPVAFKDLLHVRGWPTRKGSLATTDTLQAEDSPAAARLREAGAVLVGKTQTAEFGWSSLTETELGGITRNPWNTAHASGGSSGGAAVAAALGLAPLHVGTDGGGSIRGPAAANGVFGFKPSYGRVAGWPAAHNGDLFHIGPLARSVTDAALLFDTIARPDVRDWTSLPADGRDWRLGLDGGVKGLRIAYSRTLGGLATVDPGIAAVVEAAVERFQALGAIVEAVHPVFPDPRPIVDALSAERALRLRREIAPDRFHLIGERVRERIARAERHTLADVVAAHDARAQLASALWRFHDQHDLLLTPAQSQPVPLLGNSFDSPLWVPFNLSQQPAASVPAGFDTAGLPVGLQIVGPPFRDDLVLRAARAFESTAPFRRVGA